MKKLSKNRFVHKRRSLRVESLEERRLMAYGDNALAVVQGMVQPEQAYIKTFEFGANDFRYRGRDSSVVLQFEVRPINSQSLDVGKLTIRNVLGTKVDVLVSAENSITDGTSLLVAALPQGRYELTVKGDNCSSGDFELVVSLVGDVDGDRDVDDHDSRQLRSLLNTSMTSEAYLASADYDANGRINGFDNSLLVRNLGAASLRLSGLDFSVNTSLSPILSELPRLNASDPQPRTLSRIRSASGEVTDFVDNELYIMTDSTAELNAFVERWQGTILSSIKPSESGFAELSDMYLIQIQPELATGDLERSLHQIDPTLATGEFEVSSTRGKQLLAAAAQEAQTFASRIGISWISPPSSASLGLEDPTSRGIPDYNPDAATWPHMSSGSNQDIGVVDAWRMMRNDGIFRQLQAAGPFDEGKLELAIFDNGYIPNPDWPSWAAFPNFGVPFGLPTPFPGKLWHGSMVIAGGAGVPWNDYGAAGPGGPVVNVMAVPTSYDPFVTIAGLVAVSAAGADLVNMSFHIPVPALFSWSVLPYDLVTAAVREAGTLIFASAGNEGANIDGEVDLIFTSAEEYWYTPAENSGVLAIGGLDFDSTLRAPSSNYGRRDVDLFAPFFVYIGPSAPVDVPSARVVAGTSFSSPFAAGVAAMIWASDPDLSADQVERALLASAKQRTALEGRNHAYIDAAAAVHAVLGDTDPFVCITSPLSDSSFVQFDQNIPFQADSDDWEGAPTVVWTSDLDGEIGTGNSLTRNNLSIGTHRITATAYDSVGQFTSDTITVTVVDVAPTLFLLSPDSGRTFAEGTTIPFVVQSVDNNPMRTLPENAITWNSNLQGLLGTGHSLSVNTLSVGRHLITAQGIDASGLTSTVSVEIEIVPAISAVPEIRIVGYIMDGLGIIPTSGPLHFFTTQYDEDLRRYYLDLQLVAFASDAEDGTLESVVWTSNRTEIYGSTGLVTITPTGALRLYTTSATQGAIHLLRVSVVDSDGQRAMASIVVTIDVLI